MRDRVLFQKYLHLSYWNGVIEPLLYVSFWCNYVTINHLLIYPEKRDLHCYTCNKDQTMNPFGETLLSVLSKVYYEAHLFGNSSRETHQKT